MTAQEAGVDTEFRQRVVDVMVTVLANLLERSEPVTEDSRLMDDLDMDSTLGLELLLETEDRLQIVIDVERMNQDQMLTVGNMATFVAANCRPA
jgi:acyl carrier protein